MRTTNLLTYPKLALRATWLVPVSFGFLFTVFLAGAACQPTDTSPQLIFLREFADRLETAQVPADLIVSVDDSVASESVNDMLTSGESERRAFANVLRSAKVVFETEERSEYQVTVETPDGDIIVTSIWVISENNVYKLRLAP